LEIYLKSGGSISKRTFINGSSATNIPADADETGRRGGSDQQLARIEDDIRKLKIDYRHYFNGGAKRPPLEARAVSNRTSNGSPTTAFNLCAALFIKQRRARLLHTRIVAQAVESEGRGNLNSAG
jgi:hypothetical protein